MNEKERYEIEQHNKVALTMDKVDRLQRRVAVAAILGGFLYVFMWMVFIVSLFS